MKEVPISERARIMMKYVHQKKTIICDDYCHELGKTFEDAKGDVWRGIEVVEQVLMHHH